MYMVDKRYLMFAEIVFEKIYAYWNQIAILLSASLTEKVNIQRVSFPLILDKIPNKESINYNWLNEFRNNEYKVMNTHRKKIVHHRGLETDFRMNHHKSIGDRTKIEILIKERDMLPEYFKMHIDLTLVGFEKSLNLISEK
jgi:hypothetical protein